MSLEVIMIAVGIILAGPIGWALGMFVATLQINATERGTK